MALFYTGKGDKGLSHVGKKKYPKDSLILETLGELDELNSFLGLVRSMVKNKKLAASLEAVQQHLFIIQAQVAVVLFPEFKSPQLKKEKVAWLEREIQAIEKEIRPERGFVVPGATASAAWLDVARAIARRAERSVTAFGRKYPLPQEILPYLNRLSSYLYALARLESARMRIKEQKPTYK
jgi:cob(I)alamin adenosyltransferase